MGCARTATSRYRRSASLSCPSRFGALRAKTRMSDEVRALTIAPSCSRRTKDVYSELDRARPSVRGLTIGASLCAVIWLSSATLPAQNTSSIEVLQIRPNFYMIADAGGNIGVQVGPDGAFVVNSGRQDATSEV